MVIRMPTLGVWSPDQFVVLGDSLQGLLDGHQMPGRLGFPLSPIVLVSV